MEKMILIKYGELTTKKGNRNFFVKTLKNNLEAKIKKYDASITMDLARMYITYDSLVEKEIIEAINTTFGIHSYHMIYTCESNKEAISKLLIETVSKVNFKTFKVKVKRSDKSFRETSEELAPYFGGIVLKNKSNIKVDVHNPEVLINIEILKEKTLLYYNAFKGLGGYPIGTQPKGLLMLSGGIDSPVAGYLAMKRGIKVEAVYFEAIPHTSLEAREKVLTLAKKLAKYQTEVKVHIVPFTKIQEEIREEVTYRSKNGLIPLPNLYVDENNKFALFVNNEEHVFSSMDEIREILTINEGIYNLDLVKIDNKYKLNGNLKSIEFTYYYN